MECIFHITVYMYNIYFKIYYLNFVRTTLKYLPLIGTYYLHFLFLFITSMVSMNKLFALMGKLTKAYLP